MRVRAKFKAHMTDLNRYMDKAIKAEFDRIDKRLSASLDRAVLRIEQLMLEQIRADQSSSTQYDLLRTISWRRAATRFVLDRLYRRVPPLHGSA